MWSLGFHQCRWSYYPEQRVREVAQEFRDRQIPCDAIYLDIDYMDGYRCFTWDKDHFPKPTKMIQDLKVEQIDQQEFIEDLTSSLKEQQLQIEELKKIILSK